MLPWGRAAVFHKNGLASRCAGQFAKLGPAKLNEFGRNRAVVPALQQRQQGQDFGWWHHRLIDFHPNRHGIATGGGD